MSTAEQVQSKEESTTKCNDVDDSKCSTASHDHQFESFCALADHDQCFIISQLVCFLSIKYSVSLMRGIASNYSIFGIELSTFCGWSENKPIGFFDDSEQLLWFWKINYFRDFGKSTFETNIKRLFSNKRKKLKNKKRKKNKDCKVVADRRAFVHNVPKFAYAKLLTEKAEANFMRNMKAEFSHSGSNYNYDEKQNEKEKGKGKEAEYDTKMVKEEYYNEYNKLFDIKYCFANKNTNKVKIVASIASLNFTPNKLFYYENIIRIIIYHFNYNETIRCRKWRNMFEFIKTTSKKNKNNNKNKDMDNYDENDYDIGGVTFDFVKIYNFLNKCDVFIEWSGDQKHRKEELVSKLHNITIDRSQNEINGDDAALKLKQKYTHSDNKKNIRRVETFNAKYLFDNSNVQNGLFNFRNGKECNWSYVVWNEKLRLKMNHTFKGYMFVEQYECYQASIIEINHLETVDCGLIDMNNNNKNDSNINNNARKNMTNKPGEEHGLSLSGDHDGQVFDRFGICTVVKINKQKDIVNNVWVFERFVNVTKIANTFRNLPQNQLMRVMIIEMKKFGFRFIKDFLYITKC